MRRMDWKIRKNEFIAEKLWKAIFPEGQLG